jgi:hypothetical protein
VLRRTSSSTRIGSHLRPWSPLLSFRLQVLPQPYDSHACCTPWSVFKTGRMGCRQFATNLGRRTLTVDRKPQSSNTHCKQSASNPLTQSQCQHPKADAAY